MLTWGITFFPDFKTQIPPAAIFPVYIWDTKLISNAGVQRQTYSFLRLVHNKISSRGRLGTNTQKGTIVFLKNYFSEASTNKDMRVGEKKTIIYRSFSLNNPFPVSLCPKSYIVQIQPPECARVSTGQFAVGITAIWLTLQKLWNLVRVQVLQFHLLSSNTCHSQAQKRFIFCSISFVLLQFTKMSKIEFK